MTRTALQVIAAAFLTVGLGACSHSGHQPTMGAGDQKTGCSMTQQRADSSHLGQMGEKDKSQMVPVGCPMMGGMKKQASKADTKQPAADDHAQHHPN
jgi:hypothetical protein